MKQKIIHVTLQPFLAMNTYEVFPLIRCSSRKARTDPAIPPAKTRKPIMLVETPIQYVADNSERGEEPPSQL
jgi:hypothetical protein